MRGINKVLVMGRLGHTPELKTTVGGQIYTDLRIATNRPIKQGEKWSEIADWHQIRLWAKDAEICTKHLAKGRPVAVEGQLRTDTWISDDGQKYSRTFVHGERVHLIPTRLEKPNISAIPNVEKTAAVKQKKVSSTSQKAS